MNWPLLNANELECNLVRIIWRISKLIRHNEYQNKNFKGPTGGLKGPLSISTLPSGIKIPNNLEGHLVSLIKTNQKS